MGKGIVVLTGAGILVESGLGTFRALGRIWSRYSLRDLGTPEGFARDPVRVREFYAWRRERDREAAPNAAHLALARLEAALPGQVLLVTENLDDLHERAGSVAPLHLHGELFRSSCAGCGADWPDREPFGPSPRCPACGGDAVRPAVVWFGEMPLQMERIAAALGEAALFVSIGTSGTVWPAADFVEKARAAGAFTLELNLEPSEGASRFHEVRQGPASRLVPDWVAEVLAAG